MPVYRGVLKADAATKEGAVQFILDDTGGAVMHDVAFPVIDEGDSWRVPVFSLDGRPSAPLHVVRELAKLGRDTNGDELKERDGFESVGPNPTPDRLVEMRKNAAELQRLLKEN
jgi:hypothetical protein